MATRGLQHSTSIPCTDLRKGYLGWRNRRVAPDLFTETCACPVPPTSVCSVYTDDVCTCECVLVVSLECTLDLIKLCYELMGYKLWCLFLFHSVDAYNSLKYFELVFHCNSFSHAVTTCLKSLCKSHRTFQPSCFTVSSIYKSAHASTTAKPISQSEQITIKHKSASSFFLMPDFYCTYLLLRFGG